MMDLPVGRLPGSQSSCYLEHTCLCLQVRLFVSVGRKGVGWMDGWEGGTLVGGPVPKDALGNEKSSGVFVAITFRGRNTNLHQSRDPAHYANGRCVWKCASRVSKRYSARSKPGRGRP